VRHSHSMDQGYGGLVSTAHEWTLKLLTTDWFVLEGGVLPTDLRVRELARIRQLFPNSSSVCTRSSFPRGHTDSSTLLPRSPPHSCRHHHRSGSLAAALCLANIVADSRYMLFTEFAGE